MLHWVHGGGLRTECVAASAAVVQQHAAFPDVEHTKLPLLIVGTEERSQFWTMEYLPLNMLADAHNVQSRRITLPGQSVLHLW